MKNTHCFKLNDVAGKLMALGFVPSRDFPGFEMKFDDIRISAAISFDFVFIRGTFHTTRTIGELDLRVPARAQIGAYADALIKIVTSFHPNYINRNVEAANRHLRMIALSRPRVQVSRVLLRRKLTDLKTRIKDVSMPDASFEYQDNNRTGKESILTVRIGRELLTIPATGLWVGRIWVKSRDLFKVLDQRFQTDPVGISLYDNHYTPGKWLCIGNRSLRADWDAPQDAAPSNSVTSQ